MSDYLTRTNGGQSFTGSDVGIFQAAVIASALRLYAKTGMRANRAYTPTAMLAAAKRITGQSFKRGQYAEAADALTAYVEKLKGAPRLDASPMPADAVRS
jgi:hypothetical protein